MTAQHAANLHFLASKGFDISSLPSLRQALTWLHNTDGDNLMYGESSGDEFDKMVGEVCRQMLISSVEHAIEQMEKSIAPWRCRFRIISESLTVPSCIHLHSVN